VADHWLGLRLFNLARDARFQLLLGYLSLLSTLVWDAHNGGGAAVERLRLYRPDIRLVLSELLDYFKSSSYTRSYDDVIRSTVKSLPM
jgi:hypothetical protein